MKFVKFFLSILISFFVLFSVGECATKVDDFDEVLKDFKIDLEEMIKNGDQTIYYIKSGNNNDFWFSRRDEKPLTQFIGKDGSLVKVTKQEHIKEYYETEMRDNRETSQNYMTEEIRSSMDKNIIALKEILEAKNYYLIRENNSYGFCDNGWDEDLLTFKKMAKLTIEIVGDGEGNVQVDEESYSETTSIYVPTGKSVNIIASPGTNSKLSYIKDHNGNEISNGGACPFIEYTIIEDTIITVNFANKENIKLEIRVIGEGSVEYEDGVVKSTTRVSFIPKGTEYTFEGIESEGYELDYIKAEGYDSEPGYSSSSDFNYKAEELTNNSLSHQFNCSTVITVRFVKKEKVKLTIKVEGKGTIKYDDGEVVSTECTISIPKGEKYTFESIPALGYSFDYIKAESDNGENDFYYESNELSNNTVKDYQIDCDTVITSCFKEESFGLTVKIVGNGTADVKGLTFKSNDWSISTENVSSSKTFSVREGEIYTIEPKPGSGYCFSSIRVGSTDGAVILGKQYTMPDTSSTLYVVFKEGLGYHEDEEESHGWYWFEEVNCNSKDYKEHLIEEESHLTAEIVKDKTNYTDKSSFYTRGELIEIKGKTCMHKWIKYQKCIKHIRTGYALFDERIWPSEPHEVAGCYKIMRDTEEGPYIEFSTNLEIKLKGFKVDTNSSGPVTNATNEPKTNVINKNNGIWSTGNLRIVDIDGSLYDKVRGAHYGEIEVKCKHCNDCGDYSQNYCTKTFRIYFGENPPSNEEYNYKLIVNPQDAGTVSPIEGSASRGTEVTYNVVDLNTDYKVVNRTFYKAVNVGGELKMTNEIILAEEYDENTGAGKFRMPSHDVIGVIECSKTTLTIKVEGSGSVDYKETTSNKKSGTVSNEKVIGTKKGEEFFLEAKGDNFSHWIMPNGETDKNKNVSIKINESATITAVFGGSNEYTLYVTSMEGGSAYLDPEIDSSEYTSRETYEGKTVYEMKVKAGEEIKIEYSSDDEYVFDKWEYAPYISNSKEIGSEDLGYTIITMPAHDLTVTAIFKNEEVDINPTLRVTSNNKEWGEAYPIIEGESKVMNVPYSVKMGKVYEVVADPKEENGGYFVKWNYSSKNSPFIATNKIKMPDKDLEVMAFFAQISEPIDPSNTNRHGIDFIAKPVGGGNVPEDLTNILVGSKVTIGVTPNSGWQFDRWVINGGKVEVIYEEDGSGYFIMPDEEVYAVAHFVQDTNYKLYVTYTDGGNAWVINDIDGLYVNEIDAIPEVLYNIGFECKDGYKFAGWEFRWDEYQELNPTISPGIYLKEHNENIKCGTDVIKMPYGDLTVTANFVRTSNAGHKIRVISNNYSWGDAKLKLEDGTWKSWNGILNESGSWVQISEGETEYQIRYIKETNYEFTNWEIKLGEERYNLHELNENIGVRVISEEGDIIKLKVLKENLESDIEVVAYFKPDSIPNPDPDPDPDYYDYVIIKVDGNGSVEVNGSWINNGGEEKFIGSATINTIKSGKNWYLAGYEENGVFMDWLIPGTVFETNGSDRTIIIKFEEDEDPLPPPLFETTDGLKIISVRDLRWKDYFVEGSVMTERKIPIPKNKVTMLSSANNSISGRLQHDVIEGYDDDLLKMGYAVEFELTTSQLKPEKTLLVIKPKLIRVDKYGNMVDESIPWNSVHDYFTRSAIPAYFGEDIVICGVGMGESDTAKEDKKRFQTSSIKVEPSIENNDVDILKMQWSWLYYLPGKIYIDGYSGYDYDDVYTDETGTSLVVSFDIELHETSDADVYNDDTRKIDLVTMEDIYGGSDWEGDVYKYSLRESLFDDIYDDAIN